MSIEQKKGLKIQKSIIFLELSLHNSYVFGSLIPYEDEKLRIASKSEEQNKVMTAAASVSLIRRFVQFSVTRIRQNQLRLLSSSPASSALLQTPTSESPAPSQPLVAVHMTDNCVRVLFQFFFLYLLCTLI